MHRGTRREARRLAASTGPTIHPATDVSAAPTPETPTLTFLFTDVEGSTRLWEQYPDTMRGALERHDAILRGAIERSHGAVVKTTGDGLMAVFMTAAAAISAGLDAQRQLLAEPWPETCRIRVRMGVHSGEAAGRSDDYFGPTVNRTARIMAAGHGAQVLVSEATAALIVGELPEKASLRDLGEHRLKDLERPEHLFQLVHPDLVADFPPLATLDVRPNNLPTQTSPFIGRDAELRAIRASLDDERVRLLTLTGPGGTGKTRLALRAAVDQIDRFADGVFLVDLSSARDADTVIALIAGAVGLPETHERSPVDELKRQMRPRDVLLVLDNFEQVLVAAAVLVELLNACPGLKVMVTSREALRVRGENLFAVPALSLPSTRAVRSSASEASQFEAIQLFVERARAVKPDFRLTDDNAASVAEICRRLDGLPLAIELATARINLFSPDILLERLKSGLKVLGGGARDLPARQRTLRAAIEWSYLLLEPAEQRLLQVVSVFAGAGLEAVEAVIDGLDGGVDLDVFDGIASLTDKSLIRQVEVRDSDSGAANDVRIGMLETIREYAAEQLATSPDFATAARREHAGYYTRLAVAQWEGVSAGAEGVSVAALSTEIENLRLAWRFWASERNLDRLNELLDGLWHVYELRGWYHGTIELINDLLDVLSTSPPSQERWKQEVTLRLSLARVLTLLKGYSGEVEDAYEEALRLFEGDRQVPQVFPVLRSLASFYGFRGEVEKVIELAREIVDLAEGQDDAGMRVDGYFLLGTYAAFMGDLEGGLGHLDEAIRTFESGAYRPRRLRLGVDPRITTLTTSAFILWMLGYPDRAVDRANRAVHLAEEMGHPYSHAYALFHSGVVHHWRREPERVRERALAALRLSEESDFSVWRALGTCLLGAASSALGRSDEGLAQIADGLDQYQGLRTPPVFWPLVRSLEAGADVDGHLPERGLPLIDEALALAGPDTFLAQLFHIVRGDLLLLLPTPDVDGARDAYLHAHEVASSLGGKMSQLRALTRLCRLASRDERKARLSELRTIYETFMEGLSIPDLRDAAAVLKEG